MKKASDFVFAMFDDGETGQIGVLMTSKAHFDAHKCIESVHISTDIEPFWPVGIEMDEVQESFFLVSEDLTGQEVTDKLTAAGFVFSAELQSILSS